MASASTAGPPPPPPPPPPGLPTTYQPAPGSAGPSGAQPSSREQRPEQRPGSSQKHLGHDSHKQHHDKHQHDKHKDKHRPHDKHAPGKPKHSAVPAPAPAPATQPAATALDTRLRRDTPFLATIRFKNDLPEVPGDPKLLVLQQPPEKLAAFSITTLEKEPKHDLVLPPDLGISLSVLDMERYAVPKDKPALHPDDLKLLGPDADQLLLPGGAPLAGLSKAGMGQGSPAAGPRRGTALRSAAEVSWLMRTTYLSADADVTRARREQTEFDARREKERLPAGEELEEGDEEAQRLAQIRLIESTFTAARAPPVHGTKPGMRALEVMEVLPDVDWWSHKFMSAHFDRDPAVEMEELVALNNPDLARQVVGLSVLKGFKLEEEATQTGGRAGAANSANGRFMALLLPRDIQAAASLLQEKGASGLPADDLEGEYSWAREYSYDLNNKNTKKDADRATNANNAQQAYLLRFQGGKALYCELNSTLELRGKREAGARSRTANQFQRPSKVVLRKRAANPTEVEDAKRRRHTLRTSALEDDEQAMGGGQGGDEGLGEEEEEQ